MKSPSSSLGVHELHRQFLAAQEMLRPVQGFALWLGGVCDNVVWDHQTCKKGPRETFDPVAALLRFDDGNFRHCSVFGKRFLEELFRAPARQSANEYSIAVVVVW